MSTIAPEAARSSAFQAAPDDPPTRTARRSFRSKKTGSLASRPNRVGSASDGFLKGCSIDQSPDFNAAGAAIRAGAQSGANGFNGRGATLDGGCDLVRAHGIAGANDGTGIRLVETGPPAQKAQAFRSGNFICR